MSIMYEQRRRDGSWQERKREVYDNGNSAVVLPYDANRNMVPLTRQLRLPIYQQDGLERSIEACAGKLNGEKVEKRIIQEIEEELGYRRLPSRKKLRSSPAPTRRRTKCPRAAAWQRRAKISRSSRRHWTRPPRWSLPTRSSMPRRSFSFNILEDVFTPK
jgi:hypothetical protein